jgi:hypothetical protein
VLQSFDIPRQLCSGDERRTRNQDAVSCFGYASWRELPKCSRPNKRNAGSHLQCFCFYAGKKEHAAMIEGLVEFL